jgi:hypothetical protein
LVKSWPDDRTGRLDSVQTRVSAVGSALASGNLQAGAEAARELVALTTAWLEELEPAVIEDDETEAMLIATLRVYRNAAFAFRKLAGVNGAPDPGMADVCGAMIEQGNELQGLMHRHPGDRNPPGSRNSEA